MLTASVASLLVAAAGSSPAFAWAREIDLLAAAIGSFGSVLSFCRKDARPTMMLTAAPFAVGFVAYINLAHGIDVFAMLLFYAALLLVLVLGCRMVLTPAPFSLSRWDIAFPLTSLANAALAYSAAGHDAKLQLTAALLLLLASISIAVLCVRTLQALFAGRLSYI
jgi:tellurite resistance protein